MLHAGPFGGRANPWNFVDSPGEWCHIAPPPLPPKSTLAIEHPP